MIRSLWDLAETQLNMAEDKLAVAVSEAEAMEEVDSEVEVEALEQLKVLEDHQCLPKSLDHHPEHFQVQVDMAYLDTLSKHLLTLMNTDHFQADHQPMEDQELEEEELQSMNQATMQ